MYKYYIECLRVIDGDTIDAMIDLGFSTWVKKRIRFLGIDTPETRVLGIIRVKSHRDSINDILVAEGLAKVYPE